MSEPRYISPMLDGFTLGQSISDHSGVASYPAMRNDSEKRYIVKKISLPASQIQAEALLLTGVYRDKQSVHAYYQELAQSVAEEARILDQLAGQRGFVPYQGCQIEPMEDGVGFEVYLLGRYRKTLERHIRRNPMTHLGALNLGIDMCAALAVSREAGWLYVDLQPSNIFLFGDQEYRLGDLGFVAMDSLQYASLPDRYRSLYTAPEVADAYSSLNATMDTYALGLLLYQIYNEGKLPFKNAEERQAWFERLAAGEVMDAPRCADAEMAGIITRACAYDPDARWQTPAEMGHALISYMQRNGAEDIPIAVQPEPEPEPESAPAEEPAETAEAPEETTEEAVESMDPTEEATESVEESADETSDPEPVVEGSDEEQVNTEAPVEVPASDESKVEADMEQTASEDPVPAEEVEESAESDSAEEPAVEKSAEEAHPADWIDLMDAFLAEEEPAEPAPDTEAEEEPTLRELLGDTDEVLAEVPEITDADATEGAADILTAANELIEHEAPTPVIPPEPIDVPIPDPIPLESEEETPKEPEEVPESEAPQVPEESDGEPRNNFWKKLLRTCAALAVTAALVFALWYGYQNYYLQNIDSMTCEGTATEVVVSVITDMDESKLTVICRDTYGNSTEGTLNNGTVTFSDLVPGSQYFIALEPVGFHKLTGTTSLPYSTPAETKVIHLTAVTGQEAGSVIVSFGVEGLEPEQWTAVCSAEGLEPVSVTFSGHSVTIPGLHVGTDYVITLSADSDVLLVGETSISHTASDLVQARNLALADYRNGEITFSWTAPEGANVDRWIVRCYNSEGYDHLQEVSQTKAVFQGIADSGKYTVEVTAANMTLGIRGEFTADSNNITGFAAELNGSAIELNWNYMGPSPEEGWKILWSADGGDSQILTAESSQAVLAPAVPGSSYTFTVQPPADSGMAAPTVELTVPAPGVFSANSLDSETVIVTMHDVPTKSGWGYSALKRAKEKSAFAPGGELALLYTVTRPYDRYDSTEFETVFAIRDSEGRLVSATARTRTWKTMWDNGYCTETVSNLPAAPGSYTLTIYINGGTLAELPFSIG